jgi:MOSC domain-containing protein YiiM
VGDCHFRAKAYAGGGMETQILAVLTGKVRPFRGADEPSAIGKRPTPGPVVIGPLGLAGDEQADRVHHGGVDKAIHHYAADHYPWWRDQLDDHALLSGPGAFGENISTRGLGEDDICLGDRFRLGTALVEVSQARQPCWKLDHRFGTTGVMARVVTSGRSGWYYRVLEAGQVQAGDALTLVDRPYPDWPLSSLFALIIGGGAKNRSDDLRALTAVPVLSHSWKGRLARLIAAS